MENCSMTAFLSCCAVCTAGIFKVNPHALLGSTMNEIGVRMGASLYGRTAYAAGLLSK